MKRELFNFAGILDFSNHYVVCKEAAKLLKHLQIVYQIVVCIFFYFVNQPTKVQLQYVYKLLGFYMFRHQMCHPQGACLY